MKLIITRRYWGLICIEARHKAEAGHPEYNYGVSAQAEHISRTPDKTTSMRSVLERQGFTLDGLLFHHQ